MAATVIPGAARAQTKAYIASTTADVVTVLDTSTEAVLGVIPVGDGPLRVTFSPDGARAYVANANSGSVSVIETATDSVIATVALGASPVAVAMTPSGQQLYVLQANGTLQVVDTLLHAIVATIAVGGSGGGLAITPDGTRAYVASGSIVTIDTATSAVIDSFAAASGSASAVAISPDGSRVLVAVNGTDVFGAGAGVAVLDPVTNTVVRTIALGALPGQIAFTPDGSRAYVGIQAVWVNTGYGAAFIPGRSVAVIDAASSTVVRTIDLGAAGVAWNLQNTASGIAVAPDRSDVYVSIPRISAVAVIDTSANVVRQLTPVSPGPSGLAVAPDHSPLVPYVIDAVDDTPAAIPSTGGIAVANVLVNDTLGGIALTLAQALLTQVSASDPYIALDSSTGSVSVGAGAPVGLLSLVYEICEIAAPVNCDRGTVSVTVRNPYVVDAVDDAVSSLPGRTALATVLANDTLGGVRATTSTVRLSVVSSTSAAVTVNPSTGAVVIAAGTPAGAQVLVYRICEIAQIANCDNASVTVTVLPGAIDAVDDSGLTTRSGGTAVANVLANDKLATVQPTLAKATVALVSSTHAGVVLNPAKGSVVVAAGTPAGSYRLVYRLCETINPTNCDEATVTVVVNPYVINAVQDSARASSRNASTALASVLANDTLGSVRATTATVRISTVSLSPANNQIRLDPADGSVDILGKTSSGRYFLGYEICEIEAPTNCDRATVIVDLTSN